MSNTTHCLRPLFTQRLFEKLKHGESINLIGQRGNGCGRALQDIETMAAAEGIPVLLLDMKKYHISPDAFSKAVFEKIHGLAYNPPPQAAATDTTALALPTTNLLPLQISEILAMKEGEPAHLFLLLDNFHKLLDNPQQRFSRKFFDDLNSLKNQAHISLCCVTEKSHLLYKVHVPDEQGKISVSTSWLDLHLLEIPKLILEDIRAEIQRQLGNLPNWQQETQKEAIATALHEHMHPLELLDLLKTSYEFEDGDLNAAKRLQRTHETFGKAINPRPKASIFSWENIIGKLRDLSEIWKNFKPGK